MSDRVQIKPITGESYEGRQWGYVIELDGRPFLRATTGGTGPCWNVSDMTRYDGEDAGVPIHICDLDEMITALSALRDSDAHKENVERWS